MTENGLWADESIVEVSDGLKTGETWLVKRGMKGQPGKAVG